jgi:hypothetical protein
MSAVVIAGDTSGSITLDAPAVAGSNTLTLPAATGTVIYSNASGNLQANSGYGSVATGYLCRAWVNFNGTGTVAIRASGNVSSIIDGGTGIYGVNFTTAITDANYSAVASSSLDQETRISNYAISSFTIVTDTAVTDAATVSAAVFR